MDFFIQENRLIDISKNRFFFPSTNNNWVSKMQKLENLTFSTLVQELLNFWKLAYSGITIRYAKVEKIGNA